MDLRYTEKLEKSNDELQKRLAFAEQRIEDLLEQRVHRRYAVDYSNRSLSFGNFNSTEVLHLYKFQSVSLSMKKKTIMNEIVEKVKSLDEDKISFDTITVRCVLMQTTTVVKWSLEMFKRDGVWLYYAFHIPGGGANLSIRNQPVMWLTDAIKE